MDIIEEERIHLRIQRVLARVREFIFDEEKRVVHDLTLGQHLSVCLNYIEKVKSLSQAEIHPIIELH